MKVNELTDTNTAEPNGFARFALPAVLLKTTAEAGYLDPKPIQEQAIPPQLDGRDILGIAQTGSGKTAAFALPILAKIIALGTKRRPKTARALVLVPTRELAVQVEETFKTLAKGAHLSTALVLGGVSRFSQVKKMAPGVDVLIATPGRLHDLVQTGDALLADTKWLVLDEADRMLDMGFLHQVKRLAKATAVDRQTALFSATMPDEIAELAHGILKNPVRVEVAPQGTTVAEIGQSVVMARVKQKRVQLTRMLSDPAYSSVIVFARTKHGADRVARDLERDGIKAGVIHGNKSQNARQKALNDFRDGLSRILIATDIAARGIDVPGITHVVNFDLPDEAESYVHRIGRTGRNGASGTAVTLCAPEEAAKLRAVEKVIRKKLPVSLDLTGEPDPSQPAGQRAVPAPHAERPRQGRPAAKPSGAPRKFGRPNKPEEAGSRAHGDAAGKPNGLRPRRRRPGNRRPAAKAA